MNYSVEQLRPRSVFSRPDTADCRIEPLAQDLCAMRAVTDRIEGNTGSDSTLTFVPLLRESPPKDFLSRMYFDRGGAFRSYMLVFSTIVCPVLGKHAEIQVRALPVYPKCQLHTLS